MNAHLLFSALLSMTLTMGCGGEDDTGSDAGIVERESEASQTGGSTGSIQGVLARKKGQVQYCYELILKDKPDVAGRLAISLEIEAGQVTQAAVSENTTGSDALETCVTNKILRWRFSPEITESVYLPFALST
ncbi:MAG: hypothetical protein CL930_13440 [Deltaproteobacteria bacterium]|nr:hypothetical protein [Deltaproteobacteria bacterium]